ncbi:VWFA and cache domain-containing protein 1-like [Watersipora subatra]|uniref:VWFA and cache domain-containing protein 1-like n=1 Tax=Watersipora subatra TaxID=2589382 RepID=UPI00355BF825
MEELSKIHYNQNAQNFVIHNLRSDSQDTIDSNLWAGVVLRKAVRSIGDHLRELANKELGIITLQSIFDSIDYLDVAQDLPAKAMQIGQALESKLTSYRQLLFANKALVQSLYGFHQRTPISESLPCCSLNSSIFGDGKSSDGGGREKQHAASSMIAVCDFLPYSVSRLTFNPGRNLTSKFSQNVQRYSSLKWQYFISTEGVQNEYPAHQINSSTIPCLLVQGYRHRDVYASTIAPRRENIVLVIDRSSSLNLNQWQTAKELARQVLNSLSSNHQIAIIALAGALEYPPADCIQDRLRPATPLNKFLLTKYIDELTLANTQANHSQGLEAAFTLLPPASDAMLLYISKGSVVSLSEPKQVLDTIMMENMKRNKKLVIHTYGLTDGDETMLYQEALLRDMAMQNFSKYGLVYTGSGVMPGTYHDVSSVGASAAALNSLFVPEDSTEEDTMVISIPHNDLTDSGLVVSLTTPCLSSDGKPIGVVGADITLEDLTDVVVQSKGPRLYSFLVDSSGYMIMHPTIERSMSDRAIPSRINMTQFENLPGFSDVSVKILTSSNGSADLDVSNTSITGEQLVSPYSITFTYSWYKVPTTPYIVVVRALKSFVPLHEISGITVPEMDGMVYHRLDLGQLPAEDTCLHFQQLASFKTSALFLSAKAFERPYEHLSQPETKTMVSNYLAYITDGTTYVSKPGLREGVKDDVITVSHVNKLWLQQWKTSSYSQFIVRRYIATTTGVYRMFPASLTHKHYDPTQTNWYRQASALPGRITLSRPHIDTAGSGFTVALSHSIYEGRSAALHTPRDPIVAIMGADLPSSYFQRLLLEMIPSCDSSSLRCFILDDKGYIITHPYISAAAYGGALERQHLTHLEPLVASDILGHKSLVQKKQCNSFTDRTVQRYYQLNTSYTDTVTNLKTGEQCVRYQMSLIPGSNAFLVMVNETCELRMSAFCPCSITDRLCLNCQRMEQSECECPCECPLKSESCSADHTDSEPINPSCDLFSESNLLFQLPKEMTSRLARCVEPLCSSYPDKRSCMGVVGCAWCEYDITGKVSLDQPYCGTQRVCFGGALGARTPYNDQIQVSAENDVPHTLMKNTPVGPVTGAILGAILVLCLTVYCYRQSVLRRAQAAGALHDTPYTSCYNQEIDGCVYHELPTVPGPSAPLQARLNVADLDGAAHISPYHINENYRRPRPVVTTTESSDHGYSTMTAHEEAESSSDLSCKDPICSANQMQHSLPVSSIKLPPPPSKSTNRAIHRLRLEEGECKKLLPTVGRPQTIEEHPELQRECDLAS